MKPLSTCFALLLFAVVLRADDSIAVAVQKMAIGGFRHIPLVRDGRPVGVVSAADVFRHLLRIVE